MQACYRSLLPKLLIGNLCGIMTANMMPEDMCTVGTCVTPFKDVEGFRGNKNDILFHPPKNQQSAVGKVLYFGGDVQDYRENMLKHRDNKRHVEWCLEQTAILLHKRFPLHEIYVIRPSRMNLGTFSCYQNFVQSDNAGAPTHSLNTDALKHIKCLLSSVQERRSNANPHCTAYSDSEDGDSCNSTAGGGVSTPTLIIVGFSKGCAVLNQILYSIHALDADCDAELSEFFRTFQDMYWLDGGHSGGSNTWVTNKKVLRSFAATNIGIHIYVTPYQVSCIFRPWIGKEEKVFRETLKQLGANVHRELCFKEYPGSLEYHFRLLEAFSKSSCQVQVP